MFNLITSDQRKIQRNGKKEEKMSFSGQRQVKDRNDSHATDLSTVSLSNVCLSLIRTDPLLGFMSLHSVTSWQLFEDSCFFAAQTLRGVGVFLGLFWPDITFIQWV